MHNACMVISIAKQISCAILFPDVLILPSFKQVVIENLHMLVPVRSIVLVEEANGMAELVYSCCKVDTVSSQY